LLEGAVDTAAAGILSSLQPENLRQLNVLANHADFAGHAGLPLLFDPQTAGGLLFGVAGEHAEACVDALRQLGYADATVIGRCRGLAQAMPLISLA
jgi:selenide,water dikinase